MKTIKKIVLKNTLGITETTLEPDQINIICGKKGSGKTSILDAINTALSNKNIRTDFIRQGEKEASMYIELSDGTTIDRTKSLEKSDRIVVKSDLVKGSPESYLRELFSDKQFRPIAFVESTTREQNKTLLGMLDIKWTKDDIQGWFGELPAGIDYGQHILNILDEIQSKRGNYYLTREDLNRDIKSKNSIIEQTLMNVPENYSADKWRNTKLSDYYNDVTRAQDANRLAEIAAETVSRADEQRESILAHYKNLEKEIENRTTEQIGECIDEARALENRIEMIKKEIAEIGLKRVDIQNRAKLEIERVDSAKEINLAELNKEVDAAMLNEFNPIEIVPLQEKAEHAEKMKSFLNEYDNAMEMQKEVNRMLEESNKLTEKIEIARKLPTELLRTVNSPVEGLSVSDGMPLINGLPIQNLSTGEQLELSVQIAKQLAGELGVILVDKLECLDKESQDNFVESCKKSGLQFFMTKVDDCEFNIIKL